MVSISLGFFVQVFIGSWLVSFGFRIGFWTGFTVFFFVVALSRFFVWMSSFFVLCLQSWCFGQSAVSLKVVQAIGARCKPYFFGRVPAKSIFGFIIRTYKESI